MNCRGPFLLAVACAALTCAIPSVCPAASYTIADLGTIGGTTRIAFAISADGSVVVGASNGVSGANEAILWTVALGMVNLKDYLTTHGTTGLTGWTLSGASGISADGQTIVGSGINSLGQNEAWIATVPEPSSLVLAGAALVGLAALVRRRLSSNTHAKYGAR